MIFFAINKSCTVQKVPPCSEYPTCGKDYSGLKAFFVLYIVCCTVCAVKRVCGGLCALDRVAMKLKKTACVFPFSYHISPAKIVYLVKISV